MIRKKWQIEDNIPNLKSLLKYKKKLHSLIPVQENSIGVYNEFVPKLRSILIPLVRNKSLEFTENDVTIKIKLCGDGVKVGR